MSVQDILAQIPKLSDDEAELVQKALAKRPAERRTVHDLAGQLFDGVEGLPADLSTNPKYLTGFGQ